MKNRELSKSMGLVGSGVGVVAFLFKGMLQGALIGGTVGLKMGGYLLGESAMGGDVAVRVLAAVGMLTGVALSAAMFITTGYAVGRLAACIVGEGAAEKKAEGIAQAVRTR